MKKVIFIFSIFFILPLHNSLGKAGQQIPFQLEQKSTGVKPSPSQLRVQVENDIFKETNQIRVRDKIPALKKRSVLVLIGRDHSRDMMKRNYLSHVSPEGKTVVDRVSKKVSKVETSLGENIHTIYSTKGLYDSQAIAKQMMQDWMYSKSHRKNIMDGKFTQMGVGCYSDGFKIYCTQVFAGANL